MTRHPAPSGSFFYRTSRPNVYGLTGSTESSTAQPSNNDGCNTQQQIDVIRKIRIKDHEFLTFQNGRNINENLTQCQQAETPSIKERWVSDGRGQDEITAKCF
ncbi:hypothetical protein DPMN_025700 [Dreissena polymorpha]|uniref:Uncharacterized protein n=1 Tax=Dreissena polymorpha TaxID=45954 RepID=A0A9D4RDK1_DREPO|nr:hypothetical protein DPMN_025700 [Dreissena polymorpha]